jgi:hypothetical protein
MTLPTLAEAPRSVAAAAATLEERERDLGAAQQAVSEAEAGVAAARREDLLAAAHARDTGEDDPGAVAETAAREALAAAQREVEIETLRAGRAREGLRDALAQGAGDWASAVEKAAASADRRAEKLLAELREVERRRSDCRALAGWLEAVRGGKVPQRLRDGGGATDVRDATNAGASLPATELLDALGRYLHNSSLGARREAAADAERRGAEAEERAAQLREARRSWQPGVVGS